MAYLLKWYYDIGPSEALTYTEIQAFSEVTARSIKPWEAETLIAIDRKRLKIQYQAQRDAIKN